MPFVDLSAPLEQGDAGLPDPFRTDIVYRDHSSGAAEAERIFGVPPRLLRDGEAWAVETFTNLGSHSTTHVDAPWHYNSRLADGSPSPTIDQLPLEWFQSQGVVLDMTAKDDDDPVTPDDVEAELARIGHELRPLDIVLVRTGRDAYYGQLDYMSRGPGVTRAATLWLYDRGVRVMGIDAWGWDAPLHRQAERALALDAAGEDARGVFWEAHQAGIAYSQIERLVNLHALPPRGFTVTCFPLRLIGGSAAPARVVAHVPD